MPPLPKCHYETLSLPITATPTEIKKAHRRLALLHHPDKVLHLTNEERMASETEFKLIQAAYECLMDPMERKWYDEHREMILRGGVSGSGGDCGGGDGCSFLYQVYHYQYAGCYNGYNDNDHDSFYRVYNDVFREIYDGETRGYVSEGNIDLGGMNNAHLADHLSFGSSLSDWNDVSSFYSAWESFTSSLSFAWEDLYHLDDLRAAPNRRVRRLMEAENEKKRKAARRERVEEVLALVRFVKRRDPRVAKQREVALMEQTKKEVAKKREEAKRKEEVAAAKEEWLAQAEQNMREQEAIDLDAGRIRLADLDSEDEYTGGKRGRKKKARRKKGKKNRQTYTTSSEEESEDGCGVQEMPETAPNFTGEAAVDVEQDAADNSTVQLDSTNTLITDRDTTQQSISFDGSSSSEEEEEPTSWRCECCRKDFKSEKQFDNHIKSKKHKEMLKKYEKKLQRDAVDAMLDKLT